MYGGEEQYNIVFWENLEERNHLGNLGINGNIILDWIRKNYSGEGWIGLNAEK
jgi:hypothetical protein